MSAPLPPVVADLVEDEPFADLVTDAPKIIAVASPRPRNPIPVVMPLTPRSTFARASAFVRSVTEWCFGLAALFVGLAVLAAVPVGQFLAFGYLLESGGRVARTGRLRDGFIGIRTAAKFGGGALAGFLLWLPLYFLSIQAQAARIIDPHGRIARQWEFWLSLLATLAALHACAAVLRGGRVRDFCRPLNVPWLVARAYRGGLFIEARDRLWNTVVGLRLPYYFWLGVRGFVGAFLWLAVPLLLLGQGHRAPLVGIIGGLMLAGVVLYVPFLQVRFARDNRLRAYREFKQVRAAFRRAPLAFALALWVHLLFAIPLYVLKIELIPRDLVFLEGLMFLLFIFPARLLGGWAYARGTRRAVPRAWALRWMGRVAVVPIVAAYVIVVFLSQHLGWQGIASLYEQHAFLLPVPFVTSG
ncbi:hypothetical protein [Frigoriglobus tundricola]|uniref:DUF4013 domain-containing protein n=1 Tax=Frigoriglobus tundricola TaxID=2774151 RepID=A0A6M5YH44_9BACT|nr:hypothetical protein [Frigoriglobus tundricola]QJW92640.1 hypothetical protein FTUN_0137 [Frigoriglobus tundricola]